MSVNSEKQFGKLHKQLKEHGGFSAKVGSTKVPKHGYMVSLPGTEMQVRSQNITPAHIKEFVEKHAKELAEVGRYVGGWDNKETGETSLDVSRHVKADPKVKRQRGSAVARADARTSVMDLSEAGNQEAAWDIRKKKEIPNPHFKAEGRRGNV